MEYGKVENDADGNFCTFVGDEFNPLLEVDKFGKKNPFQDPNRGTIPNFTTQSRANTGDFPTCVMNARNGNFAFGYEDLEPFTLL